MPGFGRHLKARSSSTTRRGTKAQMATLLLAASLWPSAGLLSLPAGRAAEPALPKLKAETTAAFNHYMQIVEGRNAEELKRGTGLLWIDGLPAVEKKQAYAELKSGGVQLKQLDMLDEGKHAECPGGMIHHWVGVVFVPGARLDEVLDILEDYNRHAEYYAPEVVEAKIERHEGDHFRVFLRFRRHKVITVVLDTEHEVDYFRDAPGRAHSRSSAARIAEVQDAGKSDEREKPPGDDGGFLWRMETWWRMEEGDGGVYVQSEAASLTRDIPAGLGWMVKPFVTEIPKESLTFTLQATRKAVEARRSKPGT